APVELRPAAHPPLRAQLGEALHSRPDVPLAAGLGHGGKELVRPETGRRRVAIEGLECLRRGTRILIERAAVRAGRVTEAVFLELRRARSAPAGDAVDARAHPGRKVMLRILGAELQIAAQQMLRANVVFLHRLSGLHSWQAEDPAA